MKTCKMKTIRKQGKAALCTAAIFFLSGCIENDIPYPYVAGQITEIEVEGQTGNVLISNSAQTVELQVNDQVDLEKLRITKLKVTNNASVFPDSAKCVQAAAFPEKGFASLDSIPGSADTRVNFASPVSFLLKTYQEYPWTIKVNQIFDRKIELSGQVGAAVFDTKNRQVVVYVSKTQNLKKITVKTMQLGSSLARITPEPATVTDFSRPVNFQVVAFGRTEEWSVNVLYTDESVTTGSVSVWAKKVRLSGGMQSGSTDRPGFQYRKKIDTEWLDVPSADITLDGTTFSAWVKGLESNTSYVYRTVVGSNKGDEQEFTTEDAPLIPNLGFETWTMGSDGKTWFPNQVAEYTMWATGNEGVTMMVVNKPSNSEPVTDAVKGKAAKLTTIKVPLVNCAAGNLFVGTYKTNLQDPRKSAVMGQPYTGRPTHLRGYYKYRGGEINLSGKTSEHKDEIGKPDQFNIYIRLEDRSGGGDPVVIASADLRGAATVSEYTAFDLELNYNYDDRKPTHLVLVATSSLYGDDFVGHEGSTLYVDEFELGFE